MRMRSHFDARLEELCTDTVDMSHMVGSLLTRALDVLRSLDAAQAEDVVAADEDINEKRFALEKKCTALIATQQPAARDVRKLIAVINMIVDLERMGDQAKGIAKAVPYMVKYPDVPHPVQLNNMAYVAHQMLQDSIGGLELEKPVELLDLVELLEKVVTPLVVPTEPAPAQEVSAVTSGQHSSAADGGQGGQEGVAVENPGS